MHSPECWLRQRPRHRLEICVHRRNLRIESLLFRTSLVRFCLAPTHIHSVGAATSPRTVRAVSTSQLRYSARGRASYTCGSGGPRRERCTLSAHTTMTFGAGRASYNRACLQRKCGDFSVQIFGARREAVGRLLRGIRGLRSPTARCGPHSALAEGPWPAARSAGSWPGARRHGRPWRRPWARRARPMA